MNTFAHKISAAILLFANVIPFVLVLCFHAKQKAIRHEMKERLEEEVLQTITVSSKNVHWVKKNKEILVNGKMFDIKSYRVENGAYTFTGLWDDEETALTEQLENNFNKNKDDSGGLMTNFIQWLQSVFPYNAGNELAQLIGQQQNPPFIYTTLASTFKIVLTPPPQNS